MTTETRSQSAAADLGRSSLAHAVWTIVRKDIQIEAHTRQTISIMVMFAIVLIVMFNFAIGLSLDAARGVSSGLLWATVLLAATLGLNRSLALERENQVFDALLMAPIPRNAIFLGKVVSLSLFVILLDLICVVLFTVFFNQPFYQWPVILLLVLGTIGFVAAGVLVTSMTIQTRARDVLLPILLLPLVLPLVLPAAAATAQTIAAAAFNEPAWPQIQSAVFFVLAYDLLVLGVGLMTYRFVVES